MTCHECDGSGRVYGFTLRDGSDGPEFECRTCGGSGCEPCQNCGKPSIADAPCCSEECQREAER